MKRMILLAALLIAGTLASLARDSVKVAEQSAKMAEKEAKAMPNQ